MSKKFHVNLKTGEIGSCRASKRCPFGSLTEDHYPNEDEARKAYEVHGEAVFGKGKPSAQDKANFSEYEELLDTVDFFKKKDWEHPELIEYFSKTEMTPELFGMLMKSSEFSRPRSDLNLEDLSSRRNWDVRTAFAKHAKLNEEQFKELFADDDYSREGWLEQNPSIPQSLQLRVARGEIGLEAKGGNGILLTYNPKVTEAAMHELLNRGSDIRSSLATKAPTLPPKVKDKLLADHHPEVEEALVKRADTTPAELEEIFKGTQKVKSRVTSALFENKMTPKRVTDEMESLELKPNWL